MLRWTVAVCLLATLVAVHAGTVALGNLAVVFQGEGFKSSIDHQLKGQMHDLWCQASRDGEVQPIAHAKFVRVHDRKFYPAHIDDAQMRAVLIFGNVPVTEAGKYRCEITTVEGDHVFGNMFAYSHPVIHTNSSYKIEHREGKDEDELVSTNTVYANLGGSAILDCPVVGFPHPRVLWYKGKIPIDSSEKYVIKKKELIVKDVDHNDEGEYVCKAENVFPKHVDGPEEDHEVSLTQTVKIAGNYGWIYPLIVILIILLLLFIIIYSCQAYKRYKADQYNVARRENPKSSRADDCRRQLRVDEEKRLAEDV